MIRHIVLWKFDESYSGREKDELKNKIKQKLLSLNDVIEEIVSIKVIFNSEYASESNFEIMLDTSFENIKSLNEYQIHPEHRKVVEYIKSFNLRRAAFDYNY